MKLTLNTPGNSGKKNDVPSLPKVLNLFAVYSYAISPKGAPSYLLKNDHAPL